MNIKTFFSTWYIRSLIILVLISLVLALLSYANLTSTQARYVHHGPSTISVTGEGEMVAKPDVGMFSFAVRAEADTADAAQTDSATAMNEILAYLEGAGVEEKDIETTNYSLQPKYRYEDRVCPQGGFCPPGERILDGYTVSQMVAVKVRELDDAGELISGVGERGATNISNLQFTMDDERELARAARADAIKNAKENANTLAQQLDVELVRMVSFYEHEGRPVYGRGGNVMTESASSERITPRMPTGEEELTSTVTITYEIK